VTGSCLNTPKPCDDDNPCTDDGCDPGTGQCVLVNHQRGCDDGDVCTVDDLCQGGACAGTPKNCSALDAPCVEGTCDPQSGKCQRIVLEDGAACDDGNACTTGDTCLAKQCIAGPVTCQAQGGCSCRTSAAPWPSGLALAIAALLGFRRRCLR
jgi:MYXO-CTERM domain-containing protein